MEIARIGLNDADCKFYLYENRKELACFDNFATAAVVCRFIKAGRLEKSEYDLAVQAMKEYDEKGKAL